MTKRYSNIFGVLMWMAATAAQAGSYPVSGRWTYANPHAEGPAKASECGARYMDFKGERRFDKGGGVPDYRNVSVTGSSSNYQIVDEFFNGQARGKANYTLTLTDPDHLEIHLAGKTIALRRCE